MNKESVFKQVRGRWSSLLPLLGVPEEFLSGRHGPCPICGGSNRFRFDNNGGFGTWICSQCGAGGPLKLLELLFGWGPAEVARRLEVVLHVAPAGPALLPVNRAIVDDVVAKAKAMERMWASGYPARMDGMVWRYLRTRGISYEPRVINLRERGGEMLARVQLPDGTPCQVHRTVLGSEIKRYLMRGPHPPGSAVRLMPWDPTEPLGIAEGIETALSAAQCYNIPVWAALNAGRLKTFQPPYRCTQLIVFADNDLNDVGKQAAIALARSLDKRSIGKGGITVKILMPLRPDWDYNDVLLDSRSGGALDKFIGGANAIH